MSYSKKSKVKETTDRQFNTDVLKADKPVIVDFWAEWCGPCRMVSPILEEVANEHPEIYVVKVNVDAHPEVARDFDVVSIPTLIVFEDGITVKIIVGAHPKSSLLEELSYWLG
jgi:thioredoxin 1